MASEPYGRIKTMIALRVLIGATLLLGTAFPLYLSQRIGLAMELFKFVAVLLFLSMVYAILLDRVRNLLFFAYVQIIIDVFLWTLVVAKTGGIESPFTILYILAIITGSIVLMGRAGYLIAHTSALLFGWLVISERMELLEVQSLAVDLPLPKLELPSSYVAYVVGVSLLGFYVVALLSNYIAGRLRRTDAMLVRRIDDLNDLRILNENIVQSMASGLLITNPMGEITFINRAAAKILDLEHSLDSPPRHAIDVLPTGFWERTRSRLEDSTEPTLSTLELPFEKQDGSIQLHLAASALRSRRGSIRGIMFFLEDQTERLQLEEQRSKAEMWGQMAKLSAGLAHEIRNPLASMSGSIELLQRTLHLDETDSKLMGIVLRESDRLNELISDFLSYARPKPLHLQTVDILQLVRDSTELLRHNPRSTGIEISLDFTASRLPALVDPDQLQQVFWNLGINAVEAMEDRGTLEIRADRAPPGSLGSRRQSKDRALYYPPRKPTTAMVRIAFRDSGSGMTREQMEQVFTPFTSFKEHGTGIGLAIAYRIVENHGGLFRLESQPGEGSTFTVYVPAVVELPPA